MKYVSLGEVAEVNPARIPLEGRSLCTFIPMEAVDDITGAIVRYTNRCLDEVARGYTPFKENDVLFAKITPCMENGKCAIARGLTNGVGFGSTEFHVLRAGSHILPEWIYYFLRQESTRKAAVRHMTGSAGQQRVPASFVEKLSIPLPSLEEQRQRVAFLTKADRLCRLRRYALELREGQPTALFLKMFEDSIEQGDKTSARLRDYVTITGGGTPARSVGKYYQGTIPWLTSKDMVDDYIDDTQEHITEDAIRSSATKLVPADSVLVVVKSKILAKRLPIAVATVPLCHGQDIKSIQCGPNIDPLFLVQVLKTHERSLLEQARGANTEGLTLPMLLELPVPDVSITKQREYAAIVKKFERLRIAQREGLRQANQLRAELLARFFSSAETSKG